MQFIQICDELPDLGEIEQRADALGVMRVCYLGPPRGRYPFVQARGVLPALAGAPVLGYRTILFGGSDNFGCAKPALRG